MSYLDTRGSEVIKLHSVYCNKIPDYITEILEVPELNRINGIDINTIDTKKYYKLFAPVFQDMECYAFSLAENISMKWRKKCQIKKSVL